MPCSVHTDYFDDNCPECRQEYLEMKGANDVPESTYKDFTEERAKKLYEEVMLQYLKVGASDANAASKARAVVRKQCAIRNIPYWPWL